MAFMWIINFIKNKFMRFYFYFECFFLSLCFLFLFRSRCCCCCCCICCLWILFISNIKHLITSIVMIGVRFVRLCWRQSNNNITKIPKSFKHKSYLQSTECSITRITRITRTYTQIVLLVLFNCVPYIY